MQLFDFYIMQLISDKSQTFYTWFRRYRRWCSWRGWGRHTTKTVYPYILAVAAVLNVPARERALVQGTLRSITIQIIHSCQSCARPIEGFWSHYWVYSAEIDYSLIRIYDKTHTNLYYDIFSCENHDIQIKKGDIFLFLLKTYIVGTRFTESLRQF